MDNEHRHERDDRPSETPPPDACPPLGLVCHRCGCRHFYVVYTRKRPDGQILRRRECRHCGVRILTIEKTLGAW